MACQVLISAAAFNRADCVGRRIARLNAVCQAVFSKKFRFVQIAQLNAVFPGDFAQRLDFARRAWYSEAVASAAANSPRRPGWEHRGRLVRLLAPDAFYLLALCRSSSALRNSSMVLAFSAIAMISSRSALLASFTSSSAAVGVFKFTSPFWTPCGGSLGCWAVRPFSLGPMIAGDFCGVNGRFWKISG